MKKSKVIIAIVLAVVLVIVCMNVPTFSWFSRPHGQDGEKAMFGGSDGTYHINAFNGKNVAVSTMGSATGADGTYTTDCNGNNACSGSDVLNNNRKYFCTTLTNNSGSVQNVSLYARTLSIPTSTNNGSLALGVNGPTRSYHDYSALATPSTDANRNEMRIYFEKDNGIEGWKGTEFYICYNEDPDTSVESLDGKGSNGQWRKMQHVGGDSNPNQYFADIPSTATHAFFAVEGWDYHNNGQPDNSLRSQTLYNLKSDGQDPTHSKLYKITSDTNTAGNHLVHTPPYSVTGNCINHYYKDIFVATGSGNSFNAALSGLPLRSDTYTVGTTTYQYNANYIGTLKYYSGNDSVFTVDVDTGVITPVGAGEAILYTKSTGGSYPDEQQVETTVHVTADANYVFNDVPIVKNIEIPASTVNDANIVKVYWYVINNSPSKALSYTIDNVYIGV